MGPIGCPETPIRNYRYSLHNNPEERSNYPHLVVPDLLSLCSRIDRPILGVFVCTPTPVYRPNPCVPSLGPEYLYSLPLLTQFQIYVISPNI